MARETPGDGELDARLAFAATEICRHAAASSWAGPDPYDALWRRGLERGPLRSRRARQLLIQLHARAPVDIRRLHRRDHPRIAKSLGLFAAASLRLREGPHGEQHSSWARHALELLYEDTTAGTAGWGYPFPVQTRWSFYPAGTPNIVVTSFAALALETGAKALDEPRFAARAETAARWVLEDLYDEGRGFFAYHPGTTTLVHNANLLGARLVHRLAPGEPGSEAVRASVAATVGAQRGDGAFPYGDGPGLRFVDSFHTGYVLACLAELKGDHPSGDEALRRGAGHYLARFFGAAGEARLWPDRRFPEDAHSAGTALSTFARLAPLGLVPAETRTRVAERVLAAGIRDGHAVCRRYRLGRTRVRYLRWCDGHVAAGIADHVAAAAT